MLSAYLDPLSLSVETTVMKGLEYDRYILHLCANIYTVCNAGLIKVIIYIIV